MQTPKEYKENLQNGIVTSEMLSDALYSMNKRAKNYRNAKRKTYGDYAFHNEQKEKSFYDRKERLLSIVKPVCIHRELIGYERTRIKDTYPGWRNILIDESLKGNVVWANSYLDYDTYEEVWFFDYINPELPKYQYYLYYEIGSRTFHTPIDASKQYDLVVKEVGRIITDGNDYHDLLSVQFVDKLIELIEGGNYRLIETAPTPPTYADNLQNEKDYKTSLLIGIRALAEYYSKCITVPMMRCDLSDADKERLKNEAQNRYYNIRSKIHRKQKKGKWLNREIKPTDIKPHHPTKGVTIDVQELYQILLPLMPTTPEECVSIVEKSFSESVVRKIKQLSEYEYACNMAEVWLKEFNKK